MYEAPQMARTPTRTLQAEAEWPSAAMVANMAYTVSNANLSNAYQATELVGAR